MWTKLPVRELGLSLAVLVTSCGGDAPQGPQGGSPADDPQLALLPIPRGFPAPKIPEDNPVNQPKIDLGRRLFYEKRLSGNQTFSCGTCHEQKRAFADGKAVPTGSLGDLHTRNSQTLTNVAYNATYTWFNPLLLSIEAQMAVPLFGDDPVEMGSHGGGGAEKVLDRIRADADYVQRFKEAFPEVKGEISWTTTVKAIATFIRTMISGGSRFDRYVYERDFKALTDSEKRGMGLFLSERLECHHCHGGFNFTEASVHEDSSFEASIFNNNGLYNIDGKGGYPPNNTGVHEVTGDPDDMGRFRAPTLRNIAVTGPYMHDGSIATLEEVVAMYEAGGRVITEGPYKGDGTKSPLKSGLVAGFKLTDDERVDLINFLKALTDENFLTNPRWSDPFENP